MAQPVGADRRRFNAMAMWIISLILPRRCGPSVGANLSPFSLLFESLCYRFRSSEIERNCSSTKVPSRKLRDDLCSFISIAPSLFFASGHSNFWWIRKVETTKSLLPPVLSYPLLLSSSVLLYFVVETPLPSVRSSCYEHINEVAMGWRSRIFRSPFVFTEGAIHSLAISFILEYRVIRRCVGVVWGEFIIYIYGNS